MMKPKERSAESVAMLHDAALELSQAVVTGSPLAEAQVKLVEMLGRGDKVGNLIVALTNNRLQHDHTKVLQSDHTPLQYATPNAILHLEPGLKLVSTTESYRRHILVFENRDGRSVYLQLKIPGDKDADGADRTLVSDMDYWIPEYAARKHGANSRITAPIAMAETTGTITNYYGTGRTEEFTGAKPLRIVAFEYIDNKRLQFSDGKFVNLDAMSEARQNMLLTIKRSSDSQVQCHKQGETVTDDDLKWQIIRDGAQAIAQLLELGIVPFFVSEDPRGTFPGTNKKLWTQEMDLTPSNAGLNLLDGRVVFEGDFENCTLLKEIAGTDIPKEVSLQEGPGQDHYIKGPYDFNPYHLGEGPNQVVRFLGMTDVVSYFMASLMKKFGFANLLAFIDTRRELGLDVNEPLGIPESKISSAMIPDKDGELRHVIRALFPDVDFDAISELGPALKMIDSAH